MTECGYPNPWANDTTVKVRKGVDLSLPSLRERIVHTLADGHAAAILFATAQDASRFVAFCNRYIEVCKDHAPYGVYLRPNDPGVVQTDLFHMTLSTKMLTRMLSYLQARTSHAQLPGKRFFMPDAEKENCVVAESGSDGATFQCLTIGESLLILL